jgi:uncharacterized membrane protein (DUF441 family)
MEKAYDLKALVGYLKNEGLEVAEESAKVVYAAVMKWVVDSAVLSANPVDNIIIAVKPVLDGIVLPQLEKINPADND